MRKSTKIDTCRLSCITVCNASISTLLAVAGLRAETLEQRLNEPVPQTASAPYIWYSNVVCELITDSYPVSSLYDDFRPSVVGHDVYRNVIKVWVDDGIFCDDDFKLTVPDNYESGWNVTGGVGGFLIKNQLGDEITGDWNGSGSRDTDLVGDYTRGLRVFDGGALSDGSRLSADNYFTIEFLTRAGLHNATVQEHGFLDLINGDGGGEWSGYIHNSSLIPPLLPMRTITVNSPYGTAYIDGVATNQKTVVNGTVVTQVVQYVVDGTNGVRYRFDGYDITVSP